MHKYFEQEFTTQMAKLRGEGGKRDERVDVDY